MTQEEFVKTYLKSGKRLTALKAMGEYNIFRLAAVIHKLRKQGFNIVSDTKRSAAGRNYEEYRLES
jgi:hypothetical protein